MFTREFYPLPELAERWGCSVSDLLHLGIQDRAQICVNIYGLAKASSRSPMQLQEGYKDGSLKIHPKTEEERCIAAEIDATYGELAPTAAQVSAMEADYDAWQKRTTRNMPDGIYEIGREELRFIDMPDGSPFELYEAMKFDDGWWQVDFDPPVTISLRHLVMLQEEVARLDRERKNPPTKSLTTTERNTLLTIIAALCDYSAIKTDDRGAANQIAKMTEEIGAAVSDDTVRRWLKLIPAALGTRTK